MKARRSLFFGLGALLVLVVAAGLAFASDASPLKEPQSSPYFDATLQQAVNELDGKAKPPGTSRIAQQPTNHYTTDETVWPECVPGFTFDLASWPSCHYTTDPANPDCDIPWPTQDYTWDAILWPQCGDLTHDPGGMWCDPFWTSDPGMGMQCDPLYTKDPFQWPWCHPRYTWDPAQWPGLCMPGIPYTYDSGLWPECALELTTDPYIWPECHYTSDPWNLECVEVPIPTQDYTSNPGLWPGCPVPDPEYTANPMIWPWCDPDYTTDGTIWPECRTMQYTEESPLWPWCNPDPLYTFSPVWWPWCHYTSDPAYWTECDAQYPTKDFTWDISLWPECANHTADPVQWPWCDPMTWTTDPAQWPLCNPAWTWDPLQWSVCEPGYTNDPNIWPECSGRLYTDDPATWPECEFYTADSRLWPECHYTSDPNSADCDGVWFPTKDYTTDTQLWPECDVPPGYTSDPNTWPECHYTSDPVAWPECEPQQEYSDLGDAPDSTNHAGVGMTAYPFVPANFPTVFDPALGLPQGPKHLFPRADAWLGPWVTLENDADLPPDEDGATNIDPPPDVPDLDMADDGLIPPVLNVHCVPTVISYTVTVTPGAPMMDRFVNVWFDWNRDGDWQDIFTCAQTNDAPEWAVQDQMITVGPGTYVFQTPAYLPYDPTPGDPIWMRISIAEMQAPHMPGTPWADGRGPANGYQYGETEDYIMMTEYVEIGDLGDAPDSSNHAGANMTAYPAGGPPGTVANFPTVFDPATGLPQGPKHLYPRAAVWLGPWVTLEFDADLLPDEDPTTNISPTVDVPNQDGADDGLLFPVTLVDCTSTIISYTVTVTPGTPVQDYYVNVWFDWDRDGDWQDVFTCTNPWDAPEWAVQDHVITVGPGTHVLQTPAFLPYNPTPDVPLWMRISIAEGPAPVIPGTNQADGRGPDKGYRYGETEDYYIQSEPDPDYDIYIKDNDTDDGSVPSSIPWWMSPDIWVRNDGDCTNTTHENAIPGSTTTVCVRVRNRLTTAVTNINVDVYWANPALALTWPTSWSYIGTFNIPSLAGLATTVQSVSWSVPLFTGHFCLRAHADALQDPFWSGPDTVPPVNRSRNNNNAAQKNVNVVAYPEITGCGFHSTTVYTDVVYFDVVNTFNTAMSVDIVFDSAGFPLGTGTLMVEPGGLWMRWNTLTGFNQSGNTLLATGLPATMGDIQLTASETVRVTMTIAAEIDEQFTIDVTELDHSSSTELGGISYVRDLPNCIYVPMILRN